MPRNERARVSVPPPLVTAERCSRPSASPEEEWQRRVLVPFHPQPRAPRHNEHQLLLDLFSRTEQMSRSAGEVKNRSAETTVPSVPLPRPRCTGSRRPLRADRWPAGAGSSHRSGRRLQILLLVDLLANEFCLKLLSCRHLARALPHHTSANSVVTRDTGLLRGVTFPPRDDVPKPGVHVINA